MRVSVACVCLMVLACAGSTWGQSSSNNWNDIDWNKSLKAYMDQLYQLKTQNAKYDWVPDFMQKSVLMFSGGGIRATVGSLAVCTVLEVLGVKCEDLDAFTVSGSSWIIPLLLNDNSTNSMTKLTSNDFKQDMPLSGNNYLNWRNDVVKKQLWDRFNYKEGPVTGMKGFHTTVELYERGWTGLYRSGLLRMGKTGIPGVNVELTS